MSDTILLTGFEPFADWEVNPTEIAAQHLDGKQFGDYHIVGRVIPLRFDRIKPEISALIDQHDPAVVILSGQAGSDHIRLEQVAFNEANSEVAYNCGTITSGEVLEKDGPQRLKSTLPLDLYYHRLNSSGIAVDYSDSAGRFGCNQIFYQVRYEFSALPAGFIHIPLLPEQVSDESPSMEQSVITRALSLICEETAIFLSTEN